MGFVDKIQRAHWMYREGKHSESLAFFTEALAMAKTKGQRITLHTNRSAYYLKLHDFKKAMEECGSVLELDRKHEGALMIRVQTLVAMKEHLSALFDIHRLIELHPSSDAYCDLEARLKLQLCLSPIPECEEDVCLAECEEEEHKFQISSHRQSMDQMTESSITMRRKKGTKESKPHTDSKCWETVRKPKGHSDYSRWDSSGNDGGSENCQMMGGNYA